MDNIVASIGGLLGGASSEKAIALREVLIIINKMLPKNRHWAIRSIASLFHILSIWAGIRYISNTDLLGSDFKWMGWHILRFLVYRTKQYPIKGTNLDTKIGQEFATLPTEDTRGIFPLSFPRLSLSVLQHR